MQRFADNTKHRHAVQVSESGAERDAQKRPKTNWNHSEVSRHTAGPPPQSAILDVTS